MCPVDLFNHERESATDIYIYIYIEREREREGENSGDKELDLFRLGAGRRRDQ